MLGFELAPNVKEGTKAWNKCTQSWLQQYVFFRASVSPMYSTYFISALWHGFYPGCAPPPPPRVCARGGRHAPRVRSYYLFFLSVPLVQSLVDVVRSRVRVRFVDTPMKPVYDAVCVVLTSFSMNYLSSVFTVGCCVRAYVYMCVYVCVCVFATRHGVNVAALPHAGACLRARDDRVDVDQVLRAHHVHRAPPPAAAAARKARAEAGPHRFDAPQRRVAVGLQEGLTAAATRACLVPCQKRPNTIDE